MPMIRANGIDLCYELHADGKGDPDAPVILLIMGLATQMIAWPAEFVAGLVASGYRVVLFDNRDIGQSTELAGAPTVHPALALIAQRLNLRFPLAYGLADMAQDALGLLDALGIQSAHIVGVSMGGMIAQHVAARAPDRALSLTSIMSSSGVRGLPGPTPALRQRLTARRPANPPREQAIASAAEALRMIAYPDPAREPGAFEAIAAAAFDRSYRPRGTRRQLLAIIADGSRADLLASIRAPTLVIHGAADPLVPIANGQDVARRVPGARMEIIEEMAHDLPPSQVPRLVALIADHAAQATEHHR